MNGLKVEGYPEGVKGLVYITPDGTVLPPPHHRQYKLTLRPDGLVGVSYYVAGGLEERWPAMPAVEAGMLLMTVLTGYRYQPPPRHYPEDKPVAQSAPGSDWANGG